MKTFHPASRRRHSPAPPLSRGAPWRGQSSGVRRSLSAPLLRKASSSPSAGVLQRKIRTDCKDTKKSKKKTTVERAHQKGMKCAQQAVAELQKAQQGHRDPAVLKALWEWFRINLNTGSRRPFLDLNTVIQVFRKASAGAAKTKSFEYECDSRWNPGCLLPDPNTNAWTCYGSCNIHLCPNFFASGLCPYILVHEWTHKWANTKDHAYYTDDPVAYRRLTSTQAADNGPSYEHYLTARKC